jgi:hypothetical protein
MPDWEPTHTIHHGRSVPNNTGIHSAGMWHKNTDSEGWLLSVQADNSHQELDHGVLEVPLAV